MVPKTKTSECPEVFRNVAAAMASKTTTPEYTGVLNEQDAETIDGGLAKDIAQLTLTPPRKYEVVWRNIATFSSFHLSAIYGIYLVFTSAKIYTIAFAVAVYCISMLGITAGCHRLWAHRSYKAKLPLRILLIVFNTIAFQDCVLHWARDHRAHHKFSETDADPHNAKRGFFFSHVGWLLCKKHPDVIEKGKSLDISDLLADPVLIFQRKYYVILVPLACFILPTITPMFLWNETFLNSFFVSTMARWTFALNFTWLVNSAAHKWGSKPYDVNINPAQNPIVSALVLGEGWHNYHHVFPWDYKTAEFGNYRANFTAAFIDFFAKIGWAYDLKSVSHDVVKRRVDRTGDGSHAIWGWGDTDQDSNDVEFATVTHQKSM